MHCPAEVDSETCDRNEDGGYSGMNDTERKTTPEAPVLLRALVRDWAVVLEELRLEF